jgi:hypothetical protein
VRVKFVKLRAIEEHLWCAGIIATQPDVSREYCRASRATVFTHDDCIIVAVNIEWAQGGKPFLHHQRTRPRIFGGRAQCRVAFYTSNSWTGLCSSNCQTFAVPEILLAIKSCAGIPRRSQQLAGAQSHRMSFCATQLGLWGID